MTPGRSTPLLVLLFAGLVSPAGAQAGLDAALEAFSKLDATNSDAASRQKQFRALLAREEARERLARLVDRRLGHFQDRYARSLHTAIRQAYLNRLGSLTLKERWQVAMTRRVWRNYLLHPTTQFQFQKYFLRPATEVGRLLLPDVARITTKESKEQKRLLVEFNKYRDEVRAALGLGEDPNTGVVATTGVPFPSLTRVRSFVEQLDHLHRTMSLASSVAPLEARNILIENAVKARQIDYEEAEFVLYANEVRMLMGSVAWAIDLAACACTRDHSNDRKLGLAKGHWSSVPGKRGMGDRLRRFGTSARSEGAGGGANGRAYLHGLSYGGGHTGPLYSLKRNVVGVGRRDGAYTSVYRRDGNLIHPCHAFAGELFMPPGVTSSDIAHEDLRPIYEQLQSRNFSRAATLTKSAKVTSSFDKMLRSWFKTMIQVEGDWVIECLTRIEAAGDLYGVQTRIAGVRKEFGTRLDKRLARFEKRLRTKSGRLALAAGRAYEQAFRQGRGAVKSFLAAHPATVYAKAAAAYLKAKPGEHPLKWFLSVDRHLNRFEYLSRGKS